MTVRSNRVLSALVLVAVVFGVAAASSSSASTEEAVEVPVTATPEPTTAAPIATASATSSTFQLVETQVCNTTVSDFVYVVYNKNRALFDACVNDAQYQIFPFLGTHPSAAQIESMATSTSCIAVFTGVGLAALPECDITDMPLKAAVETLLKIDVDLQEDLADTPTTERFLAMMQWRRDVNLAAQAGVPCDSESTLYAQYESNLATALGNSSIRVLDDYTIVYKLPSGSWTSDGTTTFAALGSGSGSGVVGTVNAGDDDGSDDDVVVGQDSGSSASSSGSNAAAKTVDVPSALAFIAPLISAVVLARA